MPTLAHIDHAETHILFAARRLARKARTARHGQRWEELQREIGKMNEATEYALNMTTHVSFRISNAKKNPLPAQPRHPWHKLDKPGASISIPVTGSFHQKQELCALAREYYKRRGTKEPKFMATRIVNEIHVTRIR